MWPLACRQAPAAGRDDQTAIKFKRCRQPPEETIDESGSLNKKLIKQTAARRQVQPNPTTMQPQATTPSTSPIVLMCRRLPSLLPRPTDWSWLLARSNQSWSMRLFFFKWAHVLVIWVRPYFSQPNLFSWNTLIYCATKGTSIYTNNINGGENMVLMQPLSFLLQCIDI